MPANSDSGRRRGVPVRIDTAADPEACGDFRNTSVDRHLFSPFTNAQKDTRTH
jgi:hypothetical protein